MPSQKKMKLSMHSSQYTVPEIDLFDDYGVDAEALCEMFSHTSDEPVLVKYKCDAVCTEDEGRITLIYNEEKSKEMAGARTVVSFDKETPGTVSVVRITADENAKFKSVQNGMLLDERRGFEGSYKTVMGDFPLRCITKKVKNSLSEGGGALILDYISQLCGLDAQRIKMRIDLKPLEKEDGSHE